MARKKTSKTSSRRTSSKRPARGKKAITKKTAPKAASSKKKISRRKNASDRLMDDLRHFIRTEGSRFLKDPNITSIGIGHKITDGRRTTDLCIQFTVKQKAKEAGTLPEDVETTQIPPALRVAGKVIPTDVLERDYKPAYRLLDLPEAIEASNRKQRRDPIMPGISVSHPLGTAGTIGAIVYDRGTGDPCILSNWHVLHMAAGQVGDAIVQPGPFDDNASDFNEAGSLLRSHLGPAGDCAIARIENRNFETGILELNVTPMQIARVDLDDHVVKSGRTTGVTRGIVRRIDVMVQIEYSGIGAKIIGGFEIEPHENAPLDFEISLGGDSGSCWMLEDENGNATGIMAGLHFAGEGSGNPDEHALACYAHAVFNKLGIALMPPPKADAVASRGYNTKFLAETVRVPWLTDDQYDDAVKLDGSHLIPYTHFSVCQSKTRTLPRFVAWNIDGKNIKKLSRSGINFIRDKRIPKEFQADNALYKNNSLDRGHIARRADLTWGSMTEAEQANLDSFHYTNIAPQHQAFNQSSRAGLWGELENAILTEAKVEDLRVSVMAGPVFRNDDQLYRGVKIPREFWKLIAYQDTDDGYFKVRAYILTQQNLLTNIEVFELDEFRLYQVSLWTLGDETGMNFSSLDDFDTFYDGPQPETVGPEAREVAGVHEVIS